MILPLACALACFFLSLCFAPWAQVLLGLVCRAGSQWARYHLVRWTAGGSLVPLAYRVACASLISSPALYSLLEHFLPLSRSLRRTHGHRRVVITRYEVHGVCVARECTPSLTSRCFLICTHTFLVLSLHRTTGRSGYVACVKWAWRGGQCLDAAADLFHGWPHYYSLRPYCTQHDSAAFHVLRRRIPLWHQIGPCADSSGFFRALQFWYTCSAFPSLVCGIYR
jgi:hypothetical protein